jgi:hypothetical protein
MGEDAEGINEVKGRVAKLKRRLRAISCERGERKIPHTPIYLLRIYIRPVNFQATPGPVSPVPYGPTAAAAELEDRLEGIWISTKLRQDSKHLIRFVKAAQEDVEILKFRPHLMSQPFWWYRQAVGRTADLFV